MAKWPLSRGADPMQSYVSIKGVAPCYPCGFPCLTLPGDDGQRRYRLGTVTLENANPSNP